jgi:hypothetical protein
MQVAGNPPLLPRRTVRHQKQIAPTGSLDRGPGCRVTCGRGVPRERAGHCEVWPSAAELGGGGVSNPVSRAEKEDTRATRRCPLHEAVRQVGTTHLFAQRHALNARGEHQAHAVRHRN